MSQNGGFNQRSSRANNGTKLEWTRTPSTSSSPVVAVAVAAAVLVPVVVGLWVVGCFVLGPLLSHSAKH